MKPKDDVQGLLENFWTAKNEAVDRLAASNNAGNGAQARNAKHMLSLTDFARQMFIDAGLDESEVLKNRAIPGYFRSSKNWDAVAMHKGQLVGVVELKSQVGSAGQGFTLTLNRS